MRGAASKQCVRGMDFFPFTEEKMTKIRNIFEFLVRVNGPLETVVCIVFHYFVSRLLGKKF
jgi:hypothetical protein